MLNKVQIIGRLGANPELKYSQSGAAVCSLSVATDESYQDREGNKVSRTEWHRVSVFQRAAENCATYLTKGSLVYVEGSLQTRKWQDQQGQDRYSTDIKAQRVQFLDRKSDNAGAGYGGGHGGYIDNNQNAYQGGQGNQGYNQGSYGNQSFQGQQPRQNFGDPQGGQQYSQPAKPAGGQQQNDPFSDGSPFPSEASDMDDVPF